MSVPIILLATCVIILGAFGSKPVGWVVVALSAIALLIHVLGVV